MTLWMLAWHNIRRRPARSALTIAAVAIGIAAVVALTAIAWGFESSWQQANDARATDLIVTRQASQNTMPSPFREADVRPLLMQQAHVQQVAGLLSEMLSVSEDGPPAFVFGWEYGSYLWQHLELVEGRWPASAHEQVVVIGTLAAQTLHKGVGDHVDIEGLTFPVVGIFRSSALVENGALLMTLRQMQQTMDKPGKVNVLNIQLDASASETDEAQIQQHVRQQLHGYHVLTSGELVSRNAVVRIAKAMSQVTTLIAGLVGALMVFNTMLMSVSERRREIGLLLAVGWRKAMVMRLIVSESVGLALTGGALGILAGFVLASVLEMLPLMRGKIDPLFSPWFLLAVLGLSVVLGMAGGLLPALNAARTSPSQALRGE